MSKEGPHMGKFFEITFTVKVEGEPSEVAVEEAVTEAIDEAIPCAGSDHVRQGVRFSDLVNIAARETEGL